jgi:two-component system LytT family response regulator
MMEGSNPLKTLIADDEPLARQALRLLLSSHPDVEITGECRNVKEVISTLKTTTVDLLFLDIQMPGSTGFEVFSEIGLVHMPVTIFVTAHNRYALEAFGVHAFDYLTKPVEQERLDETLVRVKQRRASDSAFQTKSELESMLSRLENILQPAKEYPKRLFIRDGSKDAFVNVDDIEWIAAADYYSCLHVGRKEYLLRDSIRNLASQLDPHKFVRIQRSAMINVEYVKEIQLRVDQKAG